VGIPQSQDPSGSCLWYHK